MVVQGQAHPMQEYRRGEECPRSKTGGGYREIGDWKALAVGFWEILSGGMPIHEGGNCHSG